jgi:glycerol-3-phosphate dehydrogenase (NAD(P)+)
MKIKNIAVIGDGGWGTTLAIHLLKKGYDVSLWGPFPQYVEEMRQKRQNTKFLPNINLPRELKLTSDLSEALTPAQLIVFVIPSQYAQQTLKKMKPHVTNKHIFLSATKGIDTNNLFRISQMAEAELGRVPLAVLSGPTIAKEVALGVPSTAVVASKNKKLSVNLQNVFNSETFRIYTNDDVIGVELGGSVKNIIAIACGVCDGLGFGTNTKAALLNRGLVEMARLGKALGAKEKTFYGLSGLGDLATTCFSPQSRNRTVGEALGRGKSIQEILSSMDMVAEGVETAKAVYKLAQKRKIVMPITTEVYNIVCKNKNASVAVADLMTRKTKAE